ncbi:MAG: TolC family outer membrane protein [Campylobacterota bacterium]|nr:TolC family outer membrane protein [Campylobacterota bacterium]
MKIKLSLIALLTLPLCIHALTIEQMVQETIDSNPSLQQSISNYKAILYDLDKAEAGYLPTLELTGGIGPEHTDKRLYENDLVRKEVGLVATENLFEGFKTKYDIKEQEARIEGARQSVLQEANRLALRASEVYLKVVEHRDILELQKENIKTHERIYSMINEKVENGLGRRSDVEQTKGRLSLAYANYISEMNNYQDAIANFERIYGKSVPSAELVRPKQTGLPSTSLETLSNLALQYHPSLMLEDADVLTREAQYSKGKAEFYPKVDAQLSGELKDDISGLEGKDNNYQGMLRLYYNLYNGGRDEANRLQNLQYVTSQQESKNEQIRAVEEQLRLAWTTNQIVTRQITCLEQHEAMTKVAADSYAKEYQLGRRSLLDLLNVELENNSARQELVTAQSSLNFASYRILDSMGLLNYALTTNVAQSVEVEYPEDLNLSAYGAEEITYAANETFDIDIDNLCVNAPAIVAAVEEEEINPTEAMLLSSAATGEAMVVNNINFHYKSVNVTDETKQFLNDVAEFMQKHPEATLEIIAHTDSIGHRAYNVNLSNERATSVLNTLLDFGIASNRLTAVGKGEMFPIADNDTDIGRAQNRRVEFIVHSGE